MPVRPDVPARIVLNERTGTIVLGGDVRISRVGITHGNLTISVAQKFDVSQALPRADKGQTGVVPEHQVTAEEDKGKSVVLGEGSRVEDLVDALNKLGVTPRDMIAIFEAIRAAGALHADLVVI